MTNTDEVTDSCVGIFHYVLTDDQGEVIDESREGVPMPYLHGAGNIVPGLETAMAGRKVGEKFQVAVVPEEGYGVRVEDCMMTVPREQFPDDLPIEIGMPVMAEGGDGVPVTLWITNIGESDVTVDANHPLAGATLNFAIEVVGVREPTADELEHGHPHGLDGHTGH
jgi:FKBP-type peptidyl-prolyl cis-trans isomerase SlyD